MRSGGRLTVVDCKKGGRKASCVETLYILWKGCVGFSFYFIFYFTIAYRVLYGHVVGLSAEA